MVSDEFDALYVLCDGIYPPYSRFVRGIKKPINEVQHVYTKWQEAARKDVERCFGVLKGTWQYLARPIQTLDLNVLSSRVHCCLCLHNMNVTERIMDLTAPLVLKNSSIRRDKLGECQLESLPPRLERLPLPMPYRSATDSS